MSEKVLGVQMSGGCQDISFKTNRKLLYLAYFTVLGSCHWVLEVAYSTLMNPCSNSFIKSHRCPDVNRVLSRKRLCGRSRLQHSQPFLGHMTWQTFWHWDDKWQEKMLCRVYCKSQQKNHNIKLMSSEERPHTLQQKILHHLKNGFWHFIGPDTNTRIPHDQVDRSAHHDLSPKTIHCKTEVLYFWSEHGRARRHTQAS